MMVDTRILAARLMAPDAAQSQVYRIFVRDLVLSCQIGVHAYERMTTQRVRFNVEMDVRPRPGVLGDNIVNVVSYEDVTMGIRDLVARGHINLVETFADEIASLALSDPRVERVLVRVEKLEVEPEAESVGVEIERRQPQQQAGLLYSAGEKGAP